MILISRRKYKVLSLSLSLSLQNRRPSQPELASKFNADLNSIVLPAEILTGRKNTQAI